MLSSCSKSDDNTSLGGTNLLASKTIAMSNNWNILKFDGDYLMKLNSGERREIVIKQSDTTISETISYISMSAETQDSLQAGQDTTIEWKGKINEAFYEIREDGTFDFVYEYTLEKTHGKYYENGKPDPIPPFFPAYPGKPFTIDSVMKRNYRTTYSGRWNFLYNVDGWNEFERVIFEIENASHITAYSATYICNAEDDDGSWNSGDPVDTTFSRQDLEITVYKYANGERNEIWEIDELNDEFVTIKRSLDFILTHTITGYGGYKKTLSGSELYKLETK